MTITAIFGAIGSGKSWLQLQYAIRQCEKKKRRLVSNFFLDLDALYDYCCFNNYKWFVENNIDKNGIIYINSNQSLASLLSIPKSIVCLDEAGVFLNSRQFQSTPKELLSDLCQSRKDGVDLIYAAQFTKQVDAQIRMLTQFVFHCRGATIYNKEHDRPELVVKNFHLFDCETYDQWITSRHKNNPIKTRFAFAMESQTGPLSIIDSELFRCFKSLGRLDRQRPEKLSFSKGRYQPTKYRYLKIINPDYGEVETISQEFGEFKSEDDGKMDKPTPLKDAGEGGELTEKSEQQLGVGLFAIPKVAAAAKPKTETTQWEECIILVSKGNYGESIKHWNNWGLKFIRLFKTLPADSKTGVFKIARLFSKVQKAIRKIKSAFDPPTKKKSIKPRYKPLEKSFSDSISKVNYDNSYFIRSRSKKSK